MSESNETSNNSMVNFSGDFALKFADFIRQIQNTPTSPLPTVNPENLGDVVITTKLSGDNYPLWANLMSRAIGGKGLTTHISKESEPPSSTDPTHSNWQKVDHCVFGWIINNMEPELVNEVSQYPTAKELWEGLAVTYGSGGDFLQVYDLHMKASNIRQGDMTLEQLWHRLQSLRMLIDRKKPNRMKCAEDIAIRNEEVQTERLYQFLMALNESHEATRKEILKRDPLPSVKNAYAIVCREATNETVLKPAIANPNQGGIGASLAIRGGGGRGGQTPHRGEDRRFEEDRSKLVCTHCGGRKHTKEQCFHLVGYPDWWDEMKKRRASRNWSNRGNRGTPQAADRDRATGTANAAGSAGTSNARREDSEVAAALGGEEIGVAGAARSSTGNEGSKSQLNPSVSLILHSSPNSLPNFEKIPHSLFIKSSNNSACDIDPLYSHIIGKRP